MASMSRRVFVLCLALLAVGCDSQTQSEGAHVHGVARLAIAIETAQSANLELEAPAESVYGFEHEPSTPEEEAAQSEALALLEDSVDQLLVLPDSLACTLETVSVEVVQGDEEHEDEEHEGEEHEGETGEHSEVRARYTLSCEGSLDEAELEVAFGSLFPAIEDLIVTVLDASGQRSIELEGGEGTIDL